MRIYRINKFTGAIRQVFGKPKELTGKALEAENAFAERMGVAKVSLRLPLRSLPQLRLHLSYRRLVWQLQPSQLQVVQQQVS